MNDTQKKVLETLDKATAGKNPEALCSVRFGDIQTLCELAKKANPAPTETASIVPDKK